MKKFLYIIAFLTLGTAFNTKAHDEQSDPTHHSFLKPQYKGVFTENNITAFTEILRKAAVGEDISYFQDPYITERIAAHFEAVLGDKYPGSPAKVIDGIQWIPAEDFRGTIEMGMLTLDYKSTDWDPNWQPRKGEMLGLYDGIVIISSYCGNFARGEYEPPASETQKTVYTRDTVVTKTTPSSVNVSVTNTNINTNTNTNNNNNTSSTLHYGTPVDEGSGYTPDYPQDNGYGYNPYTPSRSRVVIAPRIILGGGRGYAQGSRNVRSYSSYQSPRRSGGGSRSYGGGGRVFNNSTLNPPQSGGGGGRRYNTGSLGHTPPR